MDVTKAIAKIHATDRLAAESQREKTIGCKVMELLTRDGRVSLKSLTEALRADAQGAQAKLRRLAAQVALDALSEAVARRVKP